MHNIDSEQSIFGIKEVIQEGLCIGCGVCTNQSKFATVRFNDYGELTADISKANIQELDLMGKTCPFSDSAPNENILTETIFKSEPNVTYSDVLGYYTGLMAGFSNKHRPFGSSGGIVSWLLEEILTNKTVDAVIVVGRTPDSDRFFGYKVITDPCDLQSNGTSFYYPVSYDNVLRYIQDNPGKYAITGVPCFHKALRQLKLVNPIIAQRVVLQIGIVCGQMKSSFYLEYLDRKAGKTNPLIDACFRRKDENLHADNYLFEGKFLKNNGEMQKRIVKNSDIGSNWAMGFFKPRACDFCDDVFAETADIAVMDAWLDPYISDGKGTSIVIARTNLINQFLISGQSNDMLVLNSISENNVIESQRGGLNHRRVGLRYRLHIGDSRYLPKKRVLPSATIDIWMKFEQRIRASIRAQSRSAMRIQLNSTSFDLKLFNKNMRILLYIYKWFLRLRKIATKHQNYQKEFELD